VITVGAKVDGGVDVVVRAVGRAKDAAGVAVAEGLKKAAGVILRKSNTYVPVDTGRLKASGHVQVEGSGMSARAAVVYDTDYAVYVHEILTKKHKSPTTAKFLERAVRETRGTTKSIVKRELEIGPSR
jgi:hypothetical protein